MNNIKFPVKFKFNISTLANDFTATDANENSFAYVKQKLFKLKEDITIYSNDSKSQVNYKIKADKWTSGLTSQLLIALQIKKEKK